jgi:hypothetical protein
VPYTIGPVYWGSYSGDVLEHVMAILLFQERPTAWRRRASQGDGGVDVAEPNLLGYHVNQIKGFTGSMTPSRRRQVEDSFNQIVTDPRLDGAVTGWSLIVPMDQTSQDEKWFRELTAGGSFPCDWKGQLFWDSEAGKHSNVIDYYLRDGRGRLEQTVRDLQQLLAEPGTPLRAVDIAGKLEILRSAINRADPHYRFEFSTSATVPDFRPEPGIVMTATAQIGDGGYLSVHVYARYSQATEDAPIFGSMQIVIPGGDGQPGSESLLADVDAFLDFGRALELPEGTIRELSMTAPAGLSMEAPTAGGVLRPAYLTQFRPHDERLQVIDITGQVVAETIVHMVSATVGPRGGIEIIGADAGGAFDVGIQFGLGDIGEGGSKAQINISGTPNFVGAAARHLLPGMRLLDALHSPNSLVWRPEFGPLEYVRVALPDEPVLQLPPVVLSLVEAMSVLQDYTSAPIVMPEELTNGEVLDILTSAELVEDGVVEGIWTQFNATLSADAADEDIGLGTVLAVGGGEWSTTIGHVSVLLGPCYRVLFDPRVSEVQELDDGTRRVLIVPSVGDEGRAELRLGVPSDVPDPDPGATDAA